MLAFYVRRYRQSSEREWSERIRHGAIRLDGETVAATARLRFRHPANGELIDLCAPASLPLAPRAS